MIFGFNTDVKYGTAVYHVQSEARENELLLQTQVFVKGRCIGKRATSYALQKGQPGFSDDQMHELLKDQHRRMVEAARAGRIEVELNLGGGGSEAAGLGASAVAAAPAVAANTAAVAEASAAWEKPPVAAPDPTQPPANQSVAGASAAGPADGAGPAAGSPSLTGEDVSSDKGIRIECTNCDSVYQDGLFHLQIQVSEDGQPIAGAQLTWRLTAEHVKLQQAYATTDSSGAAEIDFPLQPSQIANAAVLLQASHRDRSVSRRFRFRH